MRETKAQIDNADLILVGEVLARGSPPLAWTGIVKMTQLVAYRVIQILKGSYPHATVDILHVVMEGANTAASRRPALSTSFFRTGRRLIVFAGLFEGPEFKTESHFEDLENGVAAYSAKRVSDLRKLLLRKP
jgi:hypothetical protein